MQKLLKPAIQRQIMILTKNIMGEMLTSSREDTTIKELRETAVIAIAHEINEHWISYWDNWDPVEFRSATKE